MIPLRVSNLTKVFTTGSWLFGKRSTIPAVQGISFAINEGEIVGLLGTNGAGKTTTIQMLLGTLLPTSGQIHYFGKDFDREGPSALQHVTHASGYDKLPPNLTVGDNLDIIGRLYSMPYEERSKRIKELLAFFGMDQFRTRRTGGLSAGQMTRILLVKAFLPKPRLVLLDEPTASLDPEVAYEVRSFITAQRNTEGISALFTSHNMAEVTEVCDRVLMMQQGRIIADDSPVNLAASIKKARIALIIQGSLEEACRYAQDHGFSYKVENHEIEFEVAEDRIADVLMNLARAGITYTNVSIDKPTLEDYFLSKAKEAL